MGRGAKPGNAVFASLMPAHQGAKRAFKFHAAACQTTTRGRGVSSDCKTANASDVLIDQDGISVGIGDHEAGGTLRRGVGFGCEREAAGFELALKFAHVVEFLQWLALTRPARIEREHVALEHALEEADRGFVV